MDNAKLFEIALGITNPWYIDKIIFDETGKRLDIFVDFARGSKFYYEESGVKGFYSVHDTVKKTWRHLNFFQYECFINARIPRVKLDNNKARLIRAPWEGLSNGFTLLFEALMLQLCKNMPVEKVSKIANVSDDKLWTMLERYTECTHIITDYEGLKKVGIDETSRAKGHEYITLFVDLESRKTVFVTEGKDSKTVEKFVENLKEHCVSPEEITDVSCDMSPAFIKGVEENLPNADITFDKFHIMKILNEAVDEVRKEEAKETQVLKGTKYIFLKNEWNLTAEQSKKLNEISISNLNLKTFRAYKIKQVFQEIYKAETEKQFEDLLYKWYISAIHSNLEPIKSAAKTIKEHWHGIVRWEKSQINNGILEGLNSVIQAAKSKARGYKTFRCFKIIAYLLTGKLDFSLYNPSYVEI
jgi:transposase